MDESITSVYFVDKSNLKEAVMTFAFRKEVNWLEEGLSLISWKYCPVAYTKSCDLEKIYRAFKKWNGNAKSEAAGHRSITIGDVLLIGANPYLVLGGGWSIIPDVIWKKCRKD